MKNVRPTVFLTLMICVLIGYFEPANAAKRIAPPASSGSFVACNSTTISCPFWANPIAPGAPVTAITAGVPVTSALIMPAAGGRSYNCAITGVSQPFPLDVVENNAYFVPDLWSTLTGTSLAVPVLADGNYIFVVYTRDGKTYSTKLTISSK